MPQVTITPDGPIPPDPITDGPIPPDSGPIPPDPVSTSDSGPIPPDPISNRPQVPTVRAPFLDRARARASTFLQPTAADKRLVSEVEDMAKGIVKNLYGVSAPGIATSVLEKTSPQTAQRIPQVLRENAVPAKQLPSEMVTNFVLAGAGEGIAEEGLSENAAPKITPDVKPVEAPKPVETAARPVAPEPTAPASTATAARPSTPADTAISKLPDVPSAQFPKGLTRAQVTSQITAVHNALADVNPESIRTAEDVSKVLDQSSNRVSDYLDPRAKTVIHLSEQQALADELGLSEREVMSRAPGSALSAEQLVAARDLLAKSQASVLRMAARVTKDQSALASFTDSLARHQLILDSVQGARAEAGRALGSFRIGAEEPAAKAVDTLSKLEPEKQLEAAKLLAKTDLSNPAAINKFVREITPSTTFDKLHEAWMNGLLSGGVSTVKTASDATMRVLGMTERPVSAAIDALHSALTGAPRGRFFGELPADMYGMMRGSSRALGQFYDSFVKEMHLDKTFESSGNRVNAIKGPLGYVVRTPSRLLEAITDTAKLVNYSADLHAQAYRIAAKAGLKGAELWEKVTDLADHPTDEMRDAALKYGTHQTFQDELGPMGKKFISWRNSMPGGRWAVPFAKTPANIVKSALIDYSPYGAIKAGMSGADLTSALAKSSIGTAIIGATIYHALQGNITGAGPTSNNDRVTLESQGWQPYSLKIGDRYMSYRRLEPLGTVMALSADIAQAIKQNRDPSQMVSQLNEAVKRNVENAPFLGSIMRLNQIWEGIGTYARGFVGSLVPTGVSNVAKAMDRRVTSPRTIAEELESRLPGLTKNVPSLTGPHGATITRASNAVGGFNPYPVTTATIGEQRIEQALQRKQEALAIRAKNIARQRDLNRRRAQ